MVWQATLLMHYTHSHGQAAWPQWVKRFKGKKPLFWRASLWNKRLWVQVPLGTPVKPYRITEIGYLEQVAGLLSPGNADLLI